MSLSEGMFLKKWGCSNCLVKNSSTGLRTFPQDYFAEDVFTFLREHPLDYELVILDPPAFAKRQKDIVQACRGYKISTASRCKKCRQVLLVTCSCSHYVDEKLFQTVLFQAAMEAGRSVQIIGRHNLAADHPIHLCHPEGDYLKSLILYVH